MNKKKVLLIILFLASNFSVLYSQKNAETIEAIEKLELYNLNKLKFWQVYKRETYRIYAEYKPRKESISYKFEISRTRKDITTKVAQYLPKVDIRPLALNSEEFRKREYPFSIWDLELILEIVVKLNLESIYYNHDYDCVFFESETFSILYLFDENANKISNAFPKYTKIKNKWYFIKPR